jgi:hypothetical protein
MANNVTQRREIETLARQAIAPGVDRSRLSTADLAYRAYDFLDARVEGQFDWVPEKDGRGLKRTVFLAPVEAEEGVEMVTFHVRFPDTHSNQLEDVYCLTAGNTRYGRSGDEAAVQSVQG